MRDTPVWLVYDIGTTRTKAALVGQNGEMFRHTSREYPLRTPEGGVMEQNAADWWRAVVETTTELVAQINRSQIDGIAMTGQMQNLILIGRDGNPLRSAILYGDVRAQDEAAEVNAKIGADKLYHLTANEQDASSLLAKLLWMARHERNVLAAASHILIGSADYVAYRMTGNAASDTTNASTTGLLDIQTREILDRRIFDALGLDSARRLLPVLQHGGAYVGTVTQMAAQALGIPQGIPVHLGPGDAGAATLGVGAGEVGTVYAYLGTSGWVGFSSPSPIQAEGTWTLAHPHPELFIQVAPLLTAGGNQDWVRALFNSDDYASLSEQAFNRPPSQVLYLPYLQGERAPFRDPLARGAFVGLEMSTEKADIYRAVLEGVVYAYRHALDALVSTPVQQITLTGGGTRSRGWCQLFADILNVPVVIPTDAEFVGVRGALLAAQVSSGQLDNYAPRGYFPSSATLHPRSEYRAYYEHKYEQFLNLYPALKPTFDAMA